VRGLEYLQLAVHLEVAFLIKDVSKPLRKRSVNLVACAPEHLIKCLCLCALPLERLARVVCRLNTLAEVDGHSKLLEPLDEDSVLLV
jgi:hypothetical protein